MSGRVLAIVMSVAALAPAVAEPNAPISRRDAFFGLHFDLHPSPNDEALGADVTAENIAELLTRVRPDFVQYDCKGHGGYAGYPTEVGYPAPHIAKDSLAIWRKVTRDFGVGLFIHFSGLIDGQATAHHPEWGALNSERKLYGGNTSVFGPYVDELMLPHLKEACAKYDLDGVWLDGECWGAKLDYSWPALIAWNKETGYDSAPNNPSEPYWHEWKQFHRRAFEKYLCHWVDELHAFDPNLEVTSNWMYTTFAPQPVKCDLDFLSGDFVPSGAIGRARYDARYLSSTNMPWDLLAWGFLWTSGNQTNRCMKTALQLQQELAIVLAQGGAMQVYYQPTRRGHISEHIIDVLADVAAFCRARQDVCHKSTTVPQVALLLSRESQERRADALYAPWGRTAGIEGSLHALLELHYSVDVLAEHQLQPRLGEYAVVVIPEAIALPNEFKAALLEYVRGGGRLLAVGGQCSGLFADDLGVTFDGQPRQVDTELLSSGGLVNCRGAWQAVTPTDAKVVAQRYPDRNTTKNGAAAATIARLGQGQIAAIYADLGTQFKSYHHPATRALFGDIMRALFSEPVAELDGPPTVDLALRKTRDGRLAVHLVNLTGAASGGRKVIDFIPTVGPLTLRVRCDKSPTSVTLAPSGGVLTWRWDDGVLTVRVERLHIHEAVVIDAG